MWFVPAGKRSDGMQRYRCGQCGKTFSDHVEHDTLLGQKQAVEDAKSTLALTLLVEGNSLRTTHRVTGIARNTLMKMLVNAGERCEALLAIQDPRRSG